MSLYDNYYVKTIPDILAYVNGNDSGPNQAIVKLGDLFDVSFPELSLLDAATVVTDDDLFLVADAPATAESNKKIVASDLRTYMLNPTITVTAANAVVAIRGETSVQLQVVGTAKIKVDATGIGFFAHATAAQPTVTGSRGSNAALASLLTGLAALGLVIDSSS